MKLQFLVPQYKETEDVVKPLLDSIALQQRIDFNDIGVIICNDGSDVILNEEFLNSYPFKVEYYINQHSGVSATRNYCLDKATAEYVMFCDADDMFFNMMGVWIILQEANIGFDSMTSVFIEESKDPYGNFMFLNHEMDSTFVHGKTHRLAYLRDKKIRWNDKLTIHEDSFFNILCQSLSENVKYCPNPFYLWKWRDESVCRHDPEYILKTYNNMLDSNTELVKEFTRRGIGDKAQFYATMMIFDAYYTLNKPEWINQENQHYRDAVEKRFKQYYKEFKSLFYSIPQQEKMAISNGVRQRVIGEGMLMESLTIDQWLKKIERNKKS